MIHCEKLPLRRRSAIAFVPTEIPNYIYEAARRSQPDGAIHHRAALLIGDGKAREGIRFDTGFEHTWRNNFSMQVVFDVQNHGEIETSAPPSA